jgi:hypothetical protein
MASNFCHLCLPFFSFLDSTVFPSDPCELLLMPLKVNQRPLGLTLMLIRHYRIRLGLTLARSIRLLSLINEVLSISEPLRLSLVVGVGHFG